MAHETLAAIDMGSNSFRLEIVQVVRGQVRELIGLREPVRLASGLTARGVLNVAAQRRGLEALARFNKSLRHIPKRHIRAVATNTFRVAKNAADYQLKAETALGVPIHIISGQEEARLIYQGAIHDPRIEPNSKNNRLVVDIGGGSTEMIIGNKRKILLSKSMPMGCVAYSRQFFSDGRLTAARFDAAQEEAHRNIFPSVRSYRAEGWRNVIGTSGTINALANITYAAHLDQPFDITLRALKRLRKELIQAGHVERVHFQRLSEDRREVLPGGLSILLALFEDLGIKHLRSSKMALRHGLIFDLMRDLRQKRRKINKKSQRKK